MPMRESAFQPLVALLIGIAAALCPVAGFAWGDEGHEIVGLIAEHYLHPAVRAKVAALLATDTSGLTRTTGIADEATWADRFRESHRETGKWHYVDIELDRPDLDAACLGHDCIVDKIVQFRGELQRPATPPDERRRALQFLLHFVGDIHQPLHAADDHDRGGNDLRVRTAGEPAGTLHHYWDTVFVAALGSGSTEVAATLIAGMSEEERRSWSSDSPADWARESFDIARAHVYGRLPQHGDARRGNAQSGDAQGGDARRDDARRGTILLDGAYEADAEIIVARQLQRAGWRLARLLNQALR